MVIIHYHSRQVGGHLDLILRQSLDVVVPCCELLLLPVEGVGEQQTQVTLLLPLILDLTSPRELVHYGRLLWAAFRLFFEELVDEEILALLRVDLIEHGQGCRCQRLVAYLNRLQIHCHVLEARALMVVGFGGRRERHLLIIHHKLLDRLH